MLRTVSLKKLFLNLRSLLLPRYLAERRDREPPPASGGWLKFADTEPSPIKRRWTAHSQEDFSRDHRLKRLDSTPPSASDGHTVETDESSRPVPAGDHASSGLAQPVPMGVEAVPSHHETSTEVLDTTIVSASSSLEDENSAVADVVDPAEIVVDGEIGGEEQIDGEFAQGGSGAVLQQHAEGEVPVVRGFRAGRSSDLSALLGFTELVRGTRQAVREIVEDTSVLAGAEAGAASEPEPETPKTHHWMAAALRRAGVPGAVDVPLTPESDSEEAWKTASEWCALTPDEVAGLVANHFRLRAVDLESAEIEQIEDIPDALMRRYRAVPIAQSDRYLILAVSDPSDPHLGTAFSFVARRSVSLVVAPPEAIAEAIWKTYGWMP